MRIRHRIPVVDDDNDVTGSMATTLRAVGADVQSPHV
jgi:FixJ family two-component response regulator